MHTTIYKMLDLRHVSLATPFGILSMWFTQELSPKLSASLRAPPDDWEIKSYRRAVNHLKHLIFGYTGEPLASLVNEHRLVLAHELSLWILLCDWPESLMTESHVCRACFTTCRFVKPIHRSESTEQCSRRDSGSRDPALALWPTYPKPGATWVRGVDWAPSTTTLPLVWPVESFHVDWWSLSTVLRDDFKGCQTRGSIRSLRLIFYVCKRASISGRPRPSTYSLIGIPKDICRSEQSGSNFCRTLLHCCLAINFKSKSHSLLQERFKVMQYWWMDMQGMARYVPFVL